MKYNSVAHPNSSYETPNKHTQLDPVKHQTNTKLVLMAAITENQLRDNLIKQQPIFVFQKLHVL